MCQTRRRYSPLTGRGINRQLMQLYYPSYSHPTREHEGYPYLSLHIDSIKNNLKVGIYVIGTIKYSCPLGVPYCPTAVKYINKALESSRSHSYSSNIKKAVKAEKRHLIRLGILKVSKPQWVTSHYV